MRRMPLKAILTLQVCLALSVSQSFCLLSDTPLENSWKNAFKDFPTHPEHRQRMDAQRRECLKRFRGYYTDQGLMDEEEMDRLESICGQPLPITFRLAGKLSSSALASDRLHAQLSSLLPETATPKVSPEMAGNPFFQYP